MELDRFRLEAVRRAGPAPALRARKADRRRHVEQECHVRLGVVADRDALEAANELGVDPAERALIDARGIDEAVADDPAAGLKRGQNGVAHMIVTRRGEQEGLCLGAELLGDARQQNVADDLGARRAARFAREHHVDAGGLEALGERLGVGGLAAALPALEGDETSAHPTDS